VIVQVCSYYPPHAHEFPDDWIFDGANGQDPRADPRWMPTTYHYFDEKLKLIHITQTPLCDEQAIDEFTKVRNMGPGFRPMYIGARRPGMREPENLPFIYNPSTDEVEEL
jgi:hypothetical protein